MSNQFTPLPTPANNGSGAAVDMSSFGSTKTFTGVGLNGALVLIEMSNDLLGTEWSAVTTFQRDGERTLEIAARWMRATVSNYKGGGAPAIEVGGTDDGTLFASLPVPPGGGIGAGLDTSGLGLFKTVQVGGSFTGLLTVDVSEDGGATWATAFSFQGGVQQSQVIAAQQMRVARGAGSGTPIVNVAAVVVGGGAAGAVAPDPTKLAYFYDDFFTGQALVGVVGAVLTPSVTIEGDASSIDLINDPDTLSIGVIDLHSQASEATNASASFSLGAVAVVKFGSPAMPTLTQEWRVRADAAPTALSDFFLAIGMTDTPTYPLAQGAGPLFLAGFAEFGNGNWWVSSQGAPFSAGNCTDTGVPVTTAWVRLTIEIPDGDTQKYFIDGVQVGGTQTNDLESLEAGIAIQIRTPDGTQAHSLFADYVLCTYPINRS